MTTTKPRNWFRVVTIWRYVHDAFIYYQRELRLQKKEHPPKGDAIPTLDASLIYVSLLIAVAVSGQLVGGMLVGRVGRKSIECPHKSE